MSTQHTFICPEVTCVFESNSEQELSLHMKEYPDHSPACRIRNHQTEEKVQFKGGLSGTAKPKFSLIPYSALVALANRFTLGFAKYGEQSWNGYNTNQELVSEDWVVSRLEHVIHHAMTAIGKIKGSIPDDGDDDAGAILFGGAALAEFGKFQKEKKLPERAAFKYSGNNYICLKCEFKTMNEKEMLDHQAICFDKS